MNRQQNHKCVNVLERARYQTELLQKIPYSERIEYILKHGDEMSIEYCRICPIGKWYRRYEKSLEIKLNKIRQSGTEFIQDVLPEKSKQESYTRFL
jgi:hypothetical protein